MILTVLGLLFLILVVKADSDVEANQKLIEEYAKDIVELLEVKVNPKDVQAGTKVNSFLDIYSSIIAEISRNSSKQTLHEPHVYPFWIG